MKFLTIPLFAACSTVLGIALVSTLTETKTEYRPLAHSEITEQTLRIPDGLPETFTVSIPYSGESYTLELQKNSVIGKNTKFLVDNGSEDLQEVPGISDCSYVGSVLDYSTYTATALLTDHGLIASIIRPGKKTIQVEPRSSRTRYAIFTEDVDSRHQKMIDLLENVNSPTLEQTASNDTSETVAASTGATTVSTLVTTKSSRRKRSSATLPPERKMDVLEYEIGVEIGSKSFLSKSAYKGDIKKAQAVAQSIVSNLDARYLHAAGIKHRLGTVLIRTNPKTDPLRSTVVATGASKKASSSLAAFKNYWNDNPDKVGNTHDLAVYHVKSYPSGLAYVNSVGSKNRYATSGGNGATSWANGTLTHEFGHSWSLRHTTDSGFFYENKPRNPKGSRKAGGKSYFVSIMHGSGNHNIGRLATEEALAVYKVRQAKRKYGDVVKAPGKIKPFGHRDIASTANDKPVTIDVIKNDYDANNDVLDVELLDTVSAKGGKISISKTRGPGGRRQLTYTPPKSFNGRDFFHYTVSDSSGLRDWGAVYVDCENDYLVDTKKRKYNYDLGPTGSTVMKGWTAITPSIFGDISWSGEIISRDRGASRKVNNINRDLIGGLEKATFNHKLANGLWQITINAGDRSYAHDNMTVKAEGNIIGDKINSEKGEFPYIEAKVEVTDGELNLEFSDEGGTDKMWTVTRISLEKI